MGESEKYQKSDYSASPIAGPFTSTDKEFLYKLIGDVMISGNKSAYKVLDHLLEIADETFDQGIVDAEIAKSELIKAIFEAVVGYEQTHPEAQK